MRTGCIYGILDPLTYEIMYVGQSINVKRRFYWYSNLPKNKVRHNLRLYTWLCCVYDMGLIDKLDYIVLEDEIPVPMLDDIEEAWIIRISKTSPNLLNAVIAKKNIPVPQSLLERLSRLVKLGKGRFFAGKCGLPLTTFRLIINSKRGNPSHIKMIQKGIKYLKAA